MGIKGGSGKGLSRSTKRINTRAKHGEETNSIARMGVQRVEDPLAGSRGSAPCGVWGNAPTVPRPTNSKEAANKSAGSEASLPVTSRVLRRAPKLLFSTSMLCRASWARPSSWSFKRSRFFPQAGGFRRCCGDQRAMKTDERLRSPVGNLQVHLHVTWSLTEIR